MGGEEKSVRGALLTQLRRKLDEGILMVFFKSDVNSFQFNFSLVCMCALLHGIETHMAFLTMRAKALLNALSKSRMKPAFIEQEAKSRSKRKATMLHNTLLNNIYYL